MSLDPQEQDGQLGLHVAELAEDGMGYKAGIRREDFILKINHHPVTSPEEYFEAMRGVAETGQPLLPILLMRSGEEITVIARLRSGALPGHKRTGSESSSRRTGHQLNSVQETQDEGPSDEHPNRQDGENTDSNYHTTTRTSVDEDGNNCTIIEEVQSSTSTYSTQVVQQVHPGNMASRMVAETYQSPAKAKKSPSQSHQSPFSTKESPVRGEVNTTTHGADYTFTSPNHKDDVLDQTSDMYIGSYVNRGVADAEDGGHTEVMDMNHDNDARQEASPAPSPGGRLRQDSGRFGFVDVGNSDTVDMAGHAFDEEDEMDEHHRFSAEEVLTARREFLTMRPALGLAFLKAKEHRGLLVAQLDPGMPADLAGIQQSDVVLSVAGNQTMTKTAFLRVWQQVRPGDEVPTVILRGVDTHARVLTVGARGYSEDETLYIRAKAQYSHPDVEPFSVWLSQHPLPAPTVQPTEEDEEAAEADKSVVVAQTEAQPRRSSGPVEWYPFSTSGTPTEEEIAEATRQYGRMKKSLGMAFLTNQQDLGLQVALLDTGMPAEAAGIIKGDIIIQANGQPTQTRRQFLDMWDEVRPGDEVDVKIKRDGSVHTRVLVVGAKHYNADYVSNVRRIAHWNTDAAVQSRMMESRMKALADQGGDGISAVEAIRDEEIVHMLTDKQGASQGLVEEEEEQEEDEAEGEAEPRYPASAVQQALDENITQARELLATMRPELGMMFLAQKASWATEPGIVVGPVVPSKPAELAGFKQNDVLVSLNGVPVDSRQGFMTQWARVHPGDSIPARVLRAYDVEDSDEPHIESENLILAVGAKGYDLQTVTETKALADMPLSSERSQAEHSQPAADFQTGQSSAVLEEEQEEEEEHEGDAWERRASLSEKRVSVSKQRESVSEPRVSVSERRASCEAMQEAEQQVQVREQVQVRRSQGHQVLETQTTTTRLVQHAPRVIASPPPARRSKSLYTPEATASALAKGQTFTRYTVDGHYKVFVWYEADGRFGSFYWCDVEEAASREHSEDRQLAVRDVTDVYAGKHTAALRSAHANQARPEACFGVVAKSCTLDLESSSEEETTLWVLGIYHILSGQRGNRSPVKQVRSLTASMTHEEQVKALAQKQLASMVPDSGMTSTDHERGLLVVSVEAGRSADSAGLRAGDVVLGVESSNGSSENLGDMRPGEQVVLRIERGSGKEEMVTMIVGARNHTLAQVRAIQRVANRSSKAVPAPDERGLNSSRLGAANSHEDADGEDEEEEEEEEYLRGHDGRSSPKRTAELLSSRMSLNGAANGDDADLSYTAKRRRKESTQSVEGLDLNMSSQQRQPAVMTGQFACPYMPAVLDVLSMMQKHMSEERQVLHQRLTEQANQIAELKGVEKPAFSALQSSASLEQAGELLARLSNHMHTPMTPETQQRHQGLRLSYADRTPNKLKSDEFQRRAQAAASSNHPDVFV